MHLGPQFHQAELPGMPGRLSPSPAPKGVPQGVVTTSPVYTSARNMSGTFVPNPILEEGTPARSRFVQAINRPGALAQKDNKTDEWVPTNEIRSTQTDINADAVQHIVRNSPTGHLPSIDAYGVNHDSGRDFWVRDGNHRVNAALDKGQMIIPANVSNLKA
jgi:hypothetical protein